MEAARAGGEIFGRANAHADAAVRRSPTRRVRRAARRSATRRRAPREVAADAEEKDYRRNIRRPKEQKNVFRDGAAGGFEPASPKRRCPPETTSPPREAGASRSRELPHKQRSDMRRRAQGTRGRSRKRPVGGRSRPCNAGAAVTHVPLDSESDRQTRLSASRQRLQVQQVYRGMYRHATHYLH